VDEPRELHLAGEEAVVGERVARIDPVEASGEIEDAPEEGHVALRPEAVLLERRREAVARLDVARVEFAEEAEAPPLGEEVGAAERRVALALLIEREEGVG